MTKKITISIEDEVYAFLKNEHYNVSSFINALIRQKMVGFSSKNHTNLDSGLDEVFDAKEA